MSQEHKCRCRKHCACFRALERENKELRLQIKELHEKYYGREKTKEREQLQTKAGPKKKGAPQGHPGWWREKPGHVDEVEIIRPCRCGVCGSSDLQETTIADEEHLQEDIVLPKRVVKSSSTKF